MERREQDERRGLALLWVPVCCRYGVQYGTLKFHGQLAWGGGGVCVSCIGSAEISRVSLGADLGSLWGIV